MSFASNNKTSSALTTIIAHIGAIITVIFWGLSFVSTKIIMVDGGLSPTEAYVYRFTIAYLIVVALSHKRLWSNNWRDEMLIALCGLSGGSLYFVGENTALTLTLASNVSLLSSMSPLVTILIVALIYRNDRPGKGIVIGSFIAFAGVVCVILNSFTGAAEFKINPLGDFIALSTAFCWAIYSLVLKRVNATYDAMFITRKTFFYGIVTALPFLAFEKSLCNPFVALAEPVVIINLVFLALGASIIGYYLWAKTVSYFGAVKANNYMYLQPIVTLVASAMILGDPITGLGILGFILILFGLWFGDYLQTNVFPKR